MAYTTIPNSDIDAESPITVSLMTAIRDNVDWNVSQVQTVTGTGTLGTDDNNMMSLLDGGAGTYTYNLPSAPATGMEASFVMTDATNDVTLSGNGKNIDGSSSIVFSAVGKFLDIRYSGVEWKKLSGAPRFDFLEQVTISTAVGSIALTAGDWTKYARIIVEMRGLSPASAGVNLDMQLRDSGTYITAGSTYRYRYGATSNDIFRFGTNLDSDANLYHNGTLEIFEPTDQTRPMMRAAMAVVDNTTNDSDIETTAGRMITDVTSADGLQIFFSTGNLDAGEFTMFGELKQ
jgi:hypothetical protein